jgi:hypothetical protein
MKRLSIIFALVTSSLLAQPEQESKNVSAVPFPVAIVVQMSDGTQKPISLGAWLAFENGVLRVVAPTQYVNQPAIMQPSGAWLYNRAGRNIQVWRNGLLQREKSDYILDSAHQLITPIPVSIPDASGNLVPQMWNATDTVTVAYLY